jgi:Ni/Fe-hydrogenase subunit HybB-like protein
MLMIELMLMIRYFKELYLSGFTIIFKFGRTKAKTTGAVTAVTLIECLILAGIASWIDIFIGKRFLLSDYNSLVFSKLVIVVLFFALCSVNHLVLVTRGHGIKFERGFDNLEKSRRILLEVSCAVLLVAAIAFFIYSRLAYQRFFHL